MRLELFEKLFIQYRNVGLLNPGSGEFIEIAPGTSLKLYVSGASATIGGTS